MRDYLRALLAQRTVLVPALWGITGAILHIRGIVLSDPQQAVIQQQIAVIFDALFVISGISSARYGINQDKIAQTAAKVNETTQAVNKNADILDPEVQTPPGAAPVRVDPIDLSLVAPTAPPAPPAPPRKETP